jgi:hypothetical protein
MKKSLIFLGLGLACCAPLFAQSAPTLEFSAGGDSASVQLTPESNGTWGIAPGTQVALSNGATLTLNSLVVDADPYVFYSYSLTNTSSSIDYDTITIPNVPATLNPGAYTVSSSLGISLTDENPSGGVSVSPPSSPGAIQKGLIGAYDAGVDLGTVQLNNNTFGSTVTTNYSGGPSVYTLPETEPYVGILAAFDLSPGASVGITGFFNVQAVPEPSSVGLGLMAVGAFAFLLVRSRRSRA